MKKLSIIALMLAIAVPAFSAEHEHEHAADHGRAAAADEYVNAEDRKIDRDNGKLTLKHEALKQFDMAAMTMVFRVSDPAMLDDLAVGDQVRFVPDKANGQFVVKKIEKRP